jgi:hypothetical protein
LIGSKVIRSLVPVARANRLSVLPDGMARPLSMRATALCEVSISLASFSWVSSKLRYGVELAREITPQAVRLLARAPFP